MKFIADFYTPTENVFSTEFYEDTAKDALLQVIDRLDHGVAYDITRVVLRQDGNEVASLSPFPPTSTHPNGTQTVPVDPEDPDRWQKSKSTSRYVVAANPLYVNTVHFRPGKRDVCGNTRFDNFTDHVGEVTCSKCRTLLEAL